MATNNRRNWIVEINWQDDVPVQYGPYTQAAAEKAEARIRRWLEKNDEWTEGGDWTLGSFPINKWTASDENEAY